MSDVAERVKKIVVEHLGVEADKVTENASFIDDLGADSLDTVELVMAFEEEFGCEIPGRCRRAHPDRRRRGQISREERQRRLRRISLDGQLRQAATAPEGGREARRAFGRLRA